MRPKISNIQIRTLKQFLLLVHEFHEGNIDIGRRKRYKKVWKVSEIIGRKSRTARDYHIALEWLFWEIKEVLADRKKRKIYIE